MWEEGVRVGWGLSARDRGGSGSRIAYIADLYDGGRAAICWSLWLCCVDGLGLHAGDLLIM